MLMIGFTLVVGILLSQSTSVQPSNVSYSIVAPKEFRPGTVYNLTATCYNAPAEVRLTLSIRNQNNATLVEKTEMLGNGNTKIVSLQIPELVPTGSYKLVAVGRGGLSFEKEHTVQEKRKTLLLFVQTDKAMYKPGHKVLFRVIAVHPDLKPYRGLLDISIYDLVGNKIMQWLNQNNSAGVITQQLKLSDQTPLGEWKITVDAGENKFTKTFEVAEYVLPKFEVSVALPKFYLININRPNLQEDLLVTVTAKYTYGQMVKGRATVTLQLQPQRYMYVRQPSGDRKKMLNVELKNGKSDIRLSIKEVVELLPEGGSVRDLSDRTIKVMAEVEETVTGIVLSGNGTVDCKSVRHTLKFLDISPSNYKPGLLYTAFLHLSQVDGSPPAPSDIKLQDGSYRSIAISATLRQRHERSEYSGYGGYGRYGSSSSTKSFTVAITASGYSKFSLMIDQNVTSAYFDASFLEETTSQEIKATRKEITAFKSRDDQSLQVSFDGQHGIIEALKEATFSVKTVEPITSFQYQMMSKGNVLLSGNSVGNPSNHHTFSIRITKDLATKLAPSARFVVWIITDKGEIVSDSTEVSVSDAFANEVSLAFDRESTTPSQNVSLTVKADRGSHVSLLAVDQSVLLLKSGNDITQDMVMRELKEYSGAVTTPGYSGFGGFKHWCWWPVFIDGTNSEMIFDKSGLFVLTDAFITSDSYHRGWAYDEEVVEDFFIVETVARSFDHSQDSDFNHRKYAATVSESVEDFLQPRKNFPETWLWADMVTGPDGNVTLHTSVPDTITSWVASAFAVSDVTGLGIADSTARLIVFKKFFISPNLPYSIIRGEEFGLQVTVFNYLTKVLDVLVELEDSEYFSVIGNMSTIVTVESDDAVSVSFWIVAKSLGQIPISIKAQSPLAGDAMKVMLLVKPEGVKQQYSTSTFVQLSASSPSYNTTMTVSVPPPGLLVPGSEHIEVTVIGDLMGPSIQGLDNLLQMPYGCGEQNMLNFAPDVYIVKYLTVADQLTPDIESKAFAFMNAGYQRELTYQRNDGSFSAFGNSDDKGSIWLSSFVIKCFHQATDYIPIDDTKIAPTMRWIVNNQERDGSFVEKGRVIHTDMQGGSSRGLSLTAYVLIALLENKDNAQADSWKVQQSIRSATSYLENRTADVGSDSYALSILAYALARAKSSKVSEILQKLESLAKVEAGTKHWEKTEDASENAKRADWSPPYSQARSVNIETTSYVLLTYCHQKDLSNSVPIVKWLVKQRNANGGFSSTQDTVMALEALAEFAAMSLGPSGERNLGVSVRTGDARHDFNRITTTTALLLQSYELPSTSKEVVISASGTGSALVQLNVQYNIYQTFDISGINLKISSEQKGNTMVIKSCSSWKKDEASGMVVMEINQLTGFKASNLDNIKNQANDIIKRVESTDEQVILYFDELKSDETCVIVNMDKIFPVSKIQDAPVKVYPYYDPSGARTMFYQAPRAVPVCEECPQCCGLKPVKPNSASSLRSSIWIGLNSLVVLVISVCLL